MLGDGGRWPGRVVGDEADPGSPLAQRGDALGRPGYGDRTEVDHAVEVEQRGVVARRSPRAGRRVTRSLGLRLIVEVDQEPVQLVDPLLGVGLAVVSRPAALANQSRASAS